MAQQDFDQLSRTGTQGWTGGEGAGAHAEARGERRGHIAEEVAAARAMAVAAEGRGEIGAEPVTAGVALRIDALHGEAGQILHLFSLTGRKAQVGSRASTWRRARTNFRAPLVGQKHLRKKSPG
jgi:hypothetical protein